MNRFLSIISVLAVALCVQYSLAHDGSQEIILNRLDLAELSKIQLESRQLSPERRCDLFESKLRAMLGDDHNSRLHLFEQVAGVLAMRKLPFNNDQPALNAIKQCVDDFHRLAAAAAASSQAVDGIRREVIAPPSPVHGPGLADHLLNKDDPLAHSMREFKSVKENVKDFGQDIYLPKEHQTTGVVGSQQQHKSVYDVSDNHHHNHHDDHHNHHDDHQNHHDDHLKHHDDHHNDHHIDHDDHHIEVHGGESHAANVHLNPVAAGILHATDEHHLPSAVHPHDAHHEHHSGGSHGVHVDSHHNGLAHDASHPMELHNAHFGHQLPASHEHPLIGHLNNVFAPNHANSHSHHQAFKEERPFDRHQRAAMVAEFINDEIFDELVRNEKDPVRRLELLLENEKKLTSWLRKQMNDGQYEVAELRQKLAELQVALNRDSDTIQSSHGSHSVNKVAHHRDHLDLAERERLEELERLYKQSVDREAHIGKELRLALTRVGELEAMKLGKAHHVARHHDDSDSDSDSDSDDDDDDDDDDNHHRKRYLGHKKSKKYQKKDSMEIREPVVMAYKLQDRFKSNDDLSARCQKYYMLFTYPSEVNKKVIKTIARLSLAEFSVTSARYYETLNKYAKLVAQSANKKSRAAAKELADCTGLRQPAVHSHQHHYGHSQAHEVPVHHVVSSSTSPPHSGPSHASYYHQSPLNSAHPWSYTISHATSGASSTGSGSGSASASASASTGTAGVPRYLKFPRHSRI